MRKTKVEIISTNDKKIIDATDEVFKLLAKLDLSPPEMDVVIEICNLVIKVFLNVFEIKYGNIGNVNNETIIKNLTEDILNDREFKSFIKRMEE